MTEVQKGSEIIKRIMSMNSGDLYRTACAQVSTYNEIVCGKVVVPEEKWLKIKTLIENFPESELSRICNTKSEYRIHKWFEELRKVMEE